MKVQGWVESEDGQPPESILTGLAAYRESERRMRPARNCGDSSSPTFCCTVFLLALTGIQSTTRTGGLLGAVWYADEAAYSLAPKAVAATA